MYYDFIFVGTSAPMLYYINYLISTIDNTKNILIIESNKDRIGGAWYCITNQYCINVDHAIHFIPIYDDSTTTIAKLNKLQIETRQIEKNKLIIKNKGYIKFYDKGLLYAVNGWSDLILKLYKYLDTNTNITIIFDTVININIENDYTDVYCKNIKNIYCKKIFIPAYINLNYINFKNKQLKLLNDNNIEYMQTYHLLLYLKTERIKYNENFHAIYDGTKIFDRVMFVTKNRHMNSNHINLIGIFRISRNFKENINNTKNLDNEALNFLKDEELIYDGNIIDHTLTSYKYCYRYQEFITNKKNIIEKLKINNIIDDRIEIVDTRDLGELISKCN